MASLRRGYFSTEPIPVDVSGRLDVEYGNPGPEIGMQRQMTSAGLLCAINSEEISTTTKQERYRALSMFPRELFGSVGPMVEELKALEEDDDVYSVSVISALHDEDPVYYKHCPIDCWLKASQHAEYSPLPALSSSYAPHRASPPNIDHPPYGYGKLDKNQTRVLSLLPGHYSDPIICNLAVLTITQSESRNGPSSDIQPPYEALSYTWGDPTPTFRIELDGRSLLVANNVFSALQHLRHEGDTRTLWIDAICS